MPLTYKHKKEFTVKFLKISEYVREKKSTEHWLKYNKKQNNNKNTHTHREWTNGGGGSLAIK